MVKRSKRQDTEQYRRNAEILGSVILPKQTILSRYQIKKFARIFECQICRYKADTRHISCILSHLSDKHKITRGNRNSGPSDKFAAYIDKYFGNPKCACGCGKLVRIHKRRLEFLLFADECENSRRYVSPMCPEFYLFKGYSAADAVSMVSAVQSKMITKAHRDSLSKHNTGSNNPASIQSICNRTGFSADKVKEMLSLRTSGENNGFYGKTHTDETLNRLAILRSLQSKMVSKPELILYGILMWHRVDFEYQAPIGRYVVDFLVGNTIIEVYGDYWHSDKMYGGRRKRKDLKKEQYLKNCGYKVVVVWESQLINKDSGIRELIKCALDQ